MNAKVHPVVRIDLDVPVARVKVIGAKSRPRFDNIRNVSVVLKLNLPI